MVYEGLLINPKYAKDDVTVSAKSRPVTPIVFSHIRSRPKSNPRLLMGTPNALAGVWLPVCILKFAAPNHKLFKKIYIYF